MSLHRFIAEFITDNYKNITTEKPIFIPEEKINSVFSELPAAIPPAIKEHLQKSGVVITRFEENFTSTITIDDLINRLNSLVDAAFTLLKKPQNTAHEDFQKTINHYKEKYKQKIIANFDIDALRVNKQLSSLPEKYLEFLEEQIYPELLTFIPKENTTESKNKILKRLRKTEIKLISAKNRPTYLNITPDNYFSMEIPLGIDAESNPYTHQSYDRGGLLANWSLHVYGYINPKSKEVTILNQQTRNASYCAIDIENSAIIRMNTTIVAIKQQIGAQKTLYQAEGTTKTAFHQISYLSPIHTLVAPLDAAQQQYQQTLETYIGFNLVNMENYNADLHYFVQGVNGANVEFISDPLKEWINTRYLNQLFPKVNNRFVSLKKQCYSPTAEALLNLYAKVLNPKNDIIDSLKNNIDSSWASINTKFEECKKLLESKTPNEDLYQQKLTEITAELNRHHILEIKLAQYYQKLWEQNKNQLANYLTKMQKFAASPITDHNTKEVQELCQHLYNLQWLYYSKNYSKTEYNYEIQDNIVGILNNLGEKFGKNCNDGEDRTGAAISRYDAHSTFKREKGYVANVQTQLNDIKFYQAKLLPTNVCINNTNQIPGTHGLEIHASDGNEHLLHKEKENVIRAKLAKAPYASFLNKLTPWGVIKKTITSTIKNIATSIWDGLLWIFTPATTTKTAISNAIVKTQTDEALTTMPVVSRINYATLSSAYIPSTKKVLSSIQPTSNSFTRIVASFTLAFAAVLATGFAANNYTNIGYAPKKIDTSITLAKEKNESKKDDNDGSNPPDPSGDNVALPKENDLVSEKPREGNSNSFPKRDAVAENEKSYREKRSKKQRTNSSDAEEKGDYIPFKPLANCYK